MGFYKTGELVSSLRQDYIEIDLNRELLENARDASIYGSRPEHLALLIMTPLFFAVHTIVTVGSSVGHTLALPFTFCCNELPCQTVAYRLLKISLITPLHILSELACLVIRAVFGFLGIFVPSVTIHGMILAEKLRVKVVGLDLYFEEKLRGQNVNLKTAKESEIKPRMATGYLYRRSHPEVIEKLMDVHSKRHKQLNEASEKLQIALYAMFAGVEAADQHPDKRYMTYIGDRMQNFRGWLFSLQRMDDRGRRSYFEHDNDVTLKDIAGLKYDIEKEIRFYLRDRELYEQPAAEQKEKAADAAPGAENGEDVGKMAAEDQEEDAAPEVDDERAAKRRAEGEAFFKRTFAVRKSLHDLDKIFNLTTLIDNFTQAVKAFKHPFGWVRV